MKLEECHREPVVAEAVAAGCWPDHCPELRVHVQQCAVCTEVAAVAVALQEDHAATLSQAPVPSAGLVWWRAELRSRREAVRTAERPLTLVHAFSAAAAIGVLVAVLIQLSSWFTQRFEAFRGWMPDSPLLVLQQHTPLVLTLGIVLVLAPVALYLVLSDK
jgi:hypothetical protein